MWIVFRLERAQFVQAPWFITIDGLRRLVVFTLGVIHIRLWLTVGLAGVPKSPVLLGPRLCRVRQARPCRNFAEEDPVDTKLISLITCTIRRAHRTDRGRLTANGFLRGEGRRWRRKVWPACRQSRSLRAKDRRRE